MKAGCYLSSRSGMLTADRQCKTYMYLLLHGILHNDGGQHLTPHDLHWMSGIIVMKNQGFYVSHASGHNV